MQDIKEVRVGDKEVGEFVAIYRKNVYIGYIARISAGEWTAHLTLPPGARGADIARIIDVDGTFKRPAAVRALVASHLRHSPGA